MPIMNAKGKSKVAATSRARGTASHRKNSLAKTASMKTPLSATRGRVSRKRYTSILIEGSPELTDTPDRPTTSGKFLPGQAPKGFGDFTSRISKVDEDDSEGSDYEDAESGEPAYEPSAGEMDEIDGDMVEGSPSQAGSIAKTTRKGKKAVAKPTKKMVYKKGVRRDTTKFTTSQAMVDAEEEFDPRAAAFRGKVAKSSGNGRKKGRRLIRWTAQADQLLLLCLHHELARNKEELPYEAIAQRMFPEKNATGGAIKERFAKLRIECLNRGSWVPPILGKTPQNTRPDVRGVVRLAPGIDKGRFILWKEDASKLIDPKDINKGYVMAQGNGQQYPQRIWINVGAEREFVKSMEAHEALNLSPLAGPVPIDDDELLSDDEEEDDAEMASEDEKDEVSLPRTPNKRKAMVIPDAPKKKTRATYLASPKKFGKGTKAQVYDSEDEFVTAAGKKPDVLPTRRSSGNRYKNVAGPISAASKSKNAIPNIGVGADIEHALSMVAQSIETRNATMAPAVDPNDQGLDEMSPFPTDHRLVMMAFDKDEEVRPLRSIVIVRGLAPGALLKYPSGIQGPGDDDYADDEVVENSVVQSAGGDFFVDSDDGVRDVDSFIGNPGFQSVEGVKTVGQVKNSTHSDIYKQQFSSDFTMSNMPFDTIQSNLNVPINSGHSKFKQYDNIDDLLIDMRNNAHNGQLIDEELWHNHLEQMNVLNKKTLSSVSFHVNRARAYHLAALQDQENQERNQFNVNSSGPILGGATQDTFSNFNSPLVQTGSSLPNIQEYDLLHSNLTGNDCGPFGSGNQDSGVGFMSGEEPTTKTTVNPYELQSYGSMMVPFQSNQTSDAENKRIGEDQCQQSSVSDSYTNVNSNSSSGSATVSAQNGTLGQSSATGDEFISYDDVDGIFDGIGEADPTQAFFNDAFGPVMASRGQYDYEGYPWL